VSVGRTFLFDYFFTSSIEIDKIVGNCKSVKGISEYELAGLHKVKVCLSVDVLRLDCIWH